MAELSPAAQPTSLRVEQIVAATRALFLRYGYRRTSVDDIAREAGVAKATLYLHFAGKEDMFRTMIRRFRAEMNVRCDAAEVLAAPLTTRLSALLYAHYGTALEWFGDAAHLSELKAFASEHPIDPLGELGPAFRDRVRRVLEVGVADGEIDPALSGAALENVVQTLMLAAHGAKAVCEGGAAGLQPSLKMLVGVVVRGLGPLPPRG